jgi:SAM-dependent methyltransferase
MTENTASRAEELHREQAVFWNEAGGAKWVRMQERTDKQLAPVQEALIASAAIQPGQTIFDIGCGCGATSLALADLVGPSGRVTGFDISKPMLQRASERAAARPAGARSATLDFVLADASTFDFEPLADRVVSRFGVMFFGNPAAAFSNIRRALKPDGRLVFACWRRFDENEWMQLPLHAAYEAGIPRQPKPGPEDPGPFSFADPHRIRRILAEAGFGTPSIEPHDFELDLAGGEGLDAAIEQVTYIGAASRAMADQPPTLREAAIHAIGEALKPFAHGNHVRLNGAVWMVSCAQA